MRAIHNYYGRGDVQLTVVPDVKDTNLWEQFTTHTIPVLHHLALFLMSKIRTYESNSQQQAFEDGNKIVVPDVKDTNLWEQFTTCKTPHSNRKQLFLMSKIRTYESNSQLTFGAWKRRMVVPDVKDTNLWEQFTTTMPWCNYWFLLFLMSKIRTYESNSQQPAGGRETEWGCSWCQRYELMRAIHNVGYISTLPINVVPDVKDTNLWEQFTTTKPNIRARIKLFLMSKIRTYESNSQLMGVLSGRFDVVPDVKDTNLWEQFTTW